MPDFVPFAWFKKHEKYAWRRVSFSKVAGFCADSNVNIDYSNCNHVNVEKTGSFDNGCYLESVAVSILYKYQHGQNGPTSVWFYYYLLVSADNY